MFALAGGPQEQIANTIVEGGQIRNTYVRIGNNGRNGLNIVGMFCATCSTVCDFSDFLSLKLKKLSTSSFPTIGLLYDSLLKSQYKVIYELWFK